MRWTNILATPLWTVAGLTAMLFSSSVQAQTWEAVTEAEALRALMGGTVFEATLKGGAKAVIPRPHRDVCSWGKSGLSICSFRTRAWPNPKLPLRES